MATRKLIRRRRGLPRPDWQDETLRATLEAQGLKPPARARQLSGVSPHERELRRLVKLLRQQAGIPVRLPGHNTPPYRATPICFAAYVNLVGGGGAIQSRFQQGVQWSAFDDQSGYGPANFLRFDAVGQVAPEQFPEGQLGTITSVETWVYEYLTDTAEMPLRDTRWSLILNGAFVPGYQNMICSGSKVKSSFAAGVSVSEAHNISTAMVVPLKLAPGDQMELAYAADQLGAASQASFLSVVKGYRYPSKGVDGTVYDTLVD